MKTWREAQQAREQAKFERWFIPTLAGIIILVDFILLNNLI